MLAQTNLCLRWSKIALLAVMPLIALGCENKEISVTSGTDKRAYGRDKLLSAVEAFSKSDRSPEKYRAFADTVELLQPQFNDVVRDEAERHLAVLALTPLEANYKHPPDTRLKTLGTTVWPTALKEMPKPDETAHAFAERICGGGMALECQNVVPEYRALQLSAVVWDRFLERARTAIQSCQPCVGQKHYRDVLDKYTRYERDLSGRAAKASNLGKPSRWPLAGEHAQPWTNAPLLELADKGPHLFDGAAMEPGDWTPVLTAARADHEIMGVFIKSSARVSELRAALAEAQKAGFEQIALQVRIRQYPYSLAEYRLSTTPGEQTVRIRDIDTIQILIQALDAIAATGQQRHRI